MTTGTASVVLDDTQNDTMRNFILGTLAHGANWVTDMPLDTGQGVFEHRARLSSFSWTVLVPGITWRVSFDFETDERNSS
jgi:hypothetical protein